MRNLQKNLAAALLCGAVGFTAPVHAQIGVGSVGATGLGSTIGGSATTDAGVNGTVRPGLDTGTGTGNAGVNTSLRPGLNSTGGVNGGNSLDGVGGVNSGTGVNAVVRPGLVTGAGVDGDPGVTIPTLPGLDPGATTEEVNRAANRAIDRANAAAVRAGAPATGALGTPEIPAAGATSTPLQSNANSGSANVSGVPVQASDPAAATRIMAGTGKRGRSERAVTQALNRASREAATGTNGSATSGTGTEPGAAR
jgi:hypothetical protein